jgi:hypothetical protein
MILSDEIVLKVLRMFTPSTEDFLNFSAADVVNGPDDHALIGCSTSFPKKWLIEEGVVRRCYSFSYSLCT